MKKKKPQKYPLGTGKNGVVRHYIESPDETMVENDIMLAKAREKADNNGWAQGLNLIGNMAIQYGTSMAGAGGAGGTFKDGGSGKTIESGGFKGGNFGAPMDGSMYAAFGGQVNSQEVEVEGGEVAKLPDGGLIDFKGPDHKDDGIKTSLPVGTDIFSKRIMIGGKTMAERETDRSKKEFTLEKLLKDNSMDTILKGTLKRTKSNNAMEQEKDKRLQDVVRLIKQMGETNIKGEPTEFGDGGSVMGNLFRGLTGGVDPETGEVVDSKLPNFSGGDLVGLAGTLYSAFEPGKNTERARAGDTPNINAFKDFGNDALDRIDDAKTFIGGQQDNALKNIESNRIAATTKNRGTARGINTLRTLDTVSNVQATDASNDVYDNFAKQMVGLLSQQAGFENEQDTKVMAGEDTRDDRDRRDRDNYFSQLAVDIGTKGQGIQQVGKMLNENKKNTVSENLLNDTSKGYKVDGNGNITLKSGKKELSAAESLAVANAYGYATVEEYIESLNQ